VLGRRMLGALLVLVGMISFFLGAVEMLVAMDAAYSSIETPTPEGTSLLLPLGIALTLAGGVVLLLSSARRFA
jgi:uncharacterized membrane protein YidH (DUF202 family)